MITDQFSGQIPDLDKFRTNSGQILNVRNDHVLEHFPDNKQCPEFVYYYSEHFLDIFQTFCFYRVNIMNMSILAILKKLVLEDLEKSIVQIGEILINIWH